MKTLSSLLIEASSMEKIAKKKEFADTAEATDYMETLEVLLNSSALEHWAKQTDKNFRNLDTVSSLADAKSSFSDFIDEMFSEI